MGLYSGFYSIVSGNLRSAFRFFARFEITDTGSSEFTAISLPFYVFYAGHLFALIGPFCVQFSNVLYDANYLVLVSQNATEESSHQCSVCLKSLKSKLELVRHLLDHKNNRHDLIKCNICPQEFYDKKSLREHQDCIHGEVPTFGCNVCFSRFWDIGSLLNHRELHTSIKAGPSQKDIEIPSYPNLHLRMPAPNHTVKCEIPSIYSVARET